MERKAYIKRESKETSVELKLNIDGQRKISISTGLAFFDHMLELMAFWAGFDLDLQAKGDLDVDAHHTIEDIGICLGQALKSAWGERQGIVRMGWAQVPMDEALVESVVDVSGRAYFVAKGFELIPPVVFGEEKDVFREFFKSLALSSQINLHLIWHYGLNGHHLLEASFKALGKSLAQALTITHNQVSSTKGCLD